MGSLLDWPLISISRYRACYYPIIGVQALHSDEKIYELQCIFAGIIGAKESRLGDPLVIVKLQRARAITVLKIDLPANFISICFDWWRHTEGSSEAIEREL